MNYLSVCAGIEAASVAWHRLGWKPAMLSEIEDFPRAVLAHRQGAIDAAQTDAAKRGVPLWGDFTAIRPRFLRRLGIDGTIDLVVGGTPCQDFSVAGKRAGLDGARGNLTLEYAHLLRRIQPRWFVWENVPGCFSLNAGKDFGAILARFAGHAPGSCFDVPKEGWRNSGIVPPAGPGCYGLAWRVLDAQYVRVDSAPRAVPQRRRRVFVIGYLGDWRPAAAVLLERESMQGNPPPRRQPGQIPAQTLSARAKAGGGLGTDFDLDGGLGAGTVPRKWAKGTGGPSGDEHYNLAIHHDNDNTPIAFDCKAGGNTSFAIGPVPGSLRGEGFGGGHVAVAYPIQEVGKRTGTSTTDPRAGIGIGNDDDPMFTLQAGAQHGIAVAGAICRDSFVGGAGGRPEGAAAGHFIANGMAVRRLTPKECERLQNFPDNYTLIPMKRRRAIAYDEARYIWAQAEPGIKCWCDNGKWYTNAAPDGPRYKALGNSIATNVMEWIGHRIDTVDKLLKQMNLKGAA
jgi:DNA (cytosine-5)-methyltransferase 1